MSITWISAFHHHPVLQKVRTKGFRDGGTASEELEKNAASLSIVSEDLHLLDVALATFTML